MREYIDKESTCKVLAQDYAYAAADIVRNIPASDVAPVVHGRWEPSRYMAAIKCGACGDDIFTDDPYQYTEWNFCPHCGAKMDLEASK